MAPVRPAAARPEEVPSEIGIGIGFMVVRTGAFFDTLREVVRSLFDRSK
ncbi:hypothetical protein [Saccharothrix coeruleofusca]|nr:hypothetical protein [Saccharothrix coeruleofusca]